MTDRRRGIFITGEELNRYLNVQLRKIKNMFSSESDVMYEDLYNDIQNEELKNSFIILHSKINNLFEALNHTNNPGFGGHFHAQPSRDFLELINFFRPFQAQISKTPLSFVLDPNYEDIIIRSRSFLERSGGSRIPEDFPRIEIIEHKAVFSMLDVVTVNRVQAVETFPTKMIGEGSYATVHKYKDTQYNCFFALKKAKKDLTDKELERFKNEFLELHSFSSPYIIEAYNYNDEKNEYTMEYVDCTLDKYITENNTKLTMLQRINLIQQIFKAFDYIHEQKRLHRDISYTNILVKLYEDGTSIIKVSDFGLVKLPESNLTSEDSSIKGSLNDPALVTVGFNNYEIRHEIYALTRVINFVLSGKKVDLIDKNDAVRNFILKGMDADISNRYNNVNEMRKAFYDIRDELLSLELVGIKH